VGARGGGWVVAQFALLFVLVATVAFAPRWSDGIATLLAVVGAVVGATGVVVVVWAARTMGRSLTPFPEPASAAELVEDGPFAHVRHPVYAGALTVCVGWSLFAGPVALVLTGALALLWLAKLSEEERRLRARFPGYPAYAARVRWKLVPGLL
jgi:protein-S-isoprenylcysteine O-methyltransferase Ste14